MKFFKKFFHQSQRWLAKVLLKFHPQITIIGITGSYGKTSTTEAINKVLSEKYQTLKTDLNLDTNFNLPITLLKIRPRHQKLILEYGVDHKDEMTKHLALVKPQIGVLTGINPTHSDSNLLGSLANIMAEKSKLIESLPKDGLAILNWDDKNVRKMANNFKTKIIRYGLGLENENEYDFYAKKIKVDFTGTKFTLVYKNYSSIKNIQMQTGLIGRHFVQSCLVAVIIGLNQNLSFEEIKRGLIKLKPLSGRLSIEKGPLGSILINDSLRANPASTLAGLQTLVDLPTKERRIAVLGEMGELGGAAKEQHRIIGEKVAQLKIDFLIAVGPLQKLTAQQALKSGMVKNRVFWVSDVFKAAKILKNLLKKNDLLYLKGSRLKHMERILLILKGKKVNCKVNSCHFYCHCQDCLLRETAKDIIKIDA